ncbi:uncharacterized protein LOC103316753 [Nasonia vitripennis]|uniref:Uncharacterized protein n=1 Tax=Nasonia vitripennis TaxID=7425 RepID=A0A7M7H668_NASVI|nr:uncharacterized protein LOC103316753 [Nasonia vitripennis]
MCIRIIKKTIISRSRFRLTPRQDVTIASVFRSYKYRDYAEIRPRVFRGRRRNIGYKMDFKWIALFAFSLLLAFSFAEIDGKGVEKNSERICPPGYRRLGRTCRKVYN